MGSSIFFSLPEVKTGPRNFLRFFQVAPLDVSRVLTWSGLGKASLSLKASNSLTSTALRNSGSTVTTWGWEPMYWPQVALAPNFLRFSASSSCTDAW